jgi:hypothetical protein
MIFSKIRNFITIKATSNYNRCKIDYNHFLAKTQFNLLSSKVQYNYTRTKVSYFLKYFFTVKKIIDDANVADFIEEKQFNKNNNDLTIVAESLNFNVTLSPFYEYCESSDIFSKDIFIFLEEGPYVTENYVDTIYIVPYFSVTDYILPFIINKKIIDTPTINESIKNFNTNKKVSDISTIAESIKSFNINKKVSDVPTVSDYIKCFYNKKASNISTINDNIEFLNDKKVIVEYVSGSVEIYGKHFKLYLEEGPYEKIYSDYVEAGYYGIEGSGIISDLLTI